MARLTASPDFLLKEGATMGNGSELLVPAHEHRDDQLRSPARGGIIVVSRFIAGASPVGGDRD